MKYLCMVQIRATGEVLKEYEKEAADNYCARHQAATSFRLDHPEEKRDWWVDSVEIE